MARPLRVQLAGTWHPVWSRANRRERLFWDDTDRRRFLGLAAALPERFGAEGHAFGLILGRRWTPMVEDHGNWGRDGVLNVSTRHGGYRLVEVVGQLPGLKYQAAAQGIRRFSLALERDPARQRFVSRLRRQLSTI